MIAEILRNHCTIRSCVNDVTVFGINPKSHEKYSWTVLSTVELCQLSFQAGRNFFFIRLITESYAHQPLGVSNPTFHSALQGEPGLCVFESQEEISLSLWTHSLVLQSQCKISFLWCPSWTSQATVLWLLHLIIRWAKKLLTICWQCSSQCSPLCKWIYCVPEQNLGPNLDLLLFPCNTQVICSKTAT